MCKLSKEQQRYIDDLKAAHAAGFFVMYRPGQGCCWVPVVDPTWSNHPDCYMMEQVDRLKWEQYKRDRDCCAEQQRNKPHPHATLIKAWADGAVIQYWDGGWYDCRSLPEWNIDRKYRIKPEHTDLEKYGVEAGDVWQLVTGDNVFIQSCNGTKIGGYSLKFDSGYISRRKEQLLGVLFRRGVVNKL